ncbi:hypothetical protein V8G54_030994 [Vigna mungo]|uniref:Uncharacterized protein n=1 Tax=Vigna mungo TaxID=3915 RepID=A0AAQ3MXG1_VIGMU
MSMIFLAEEKGPRKERLVFWFGKMNMGGRWNYDHAFFMLSLLLVGSSTVVGLAEAGSRVATEGCERGYNKSVGKKLYCWNPAMDVFDVFDDHTNQDERQRQLRTEKRLNVALAHVNLSANTPRHGRAVHEAADRVLAAADCGRTRFIFFIMISLLALKRAPRVLANLSLRETEYTEHIVPSTGPQGSWRPRAINSKPQFSVLHLKGKTLPSVQRKVRVFGGLVPGCRKEPLSIILEEAIDYIPVESSEKYMNDTSFSNAENLYLDEADKAWTTHINVLRISISDWFTLKLF